jgi:hypothetical protein
MRDEKKEELTTKTPRHEARKKEKGAGKDDIPHPSSFIPHPLTLNP